MHLRLQNCIDDRLRDAFFLGILHILIGGLEADTVLLNLRDHLALRNLVIEHVGEIVHAKRPLAYGSALRRFGITDQVRQRLVLHFNRAYRVVRSSLVNGSHGHHFIAGPMNGGTFFLDDLDCLDVVTADGSVYKFYLAISQSYGNRRL